MDAHELESSGAAVGALEAERRAKVEALRALGIDPYPIHFVPSDTLGELRARFLDLGPDTRTGVHTTVGGRVTAWRGHGQLSFLRLSQGDEHIQLLVQRRLLDPASRAVLEAGDLGDWLGASGEVITSRRGELSVEVGRLTMLAKALRPLPDKYHGLAEADTRTRQREVDLIANEASRRTFAIRFATIAALRAGLVERGFVEVDTPILQPLAGGAIARPFATHAHALDLDLTLRIAPELYLKRLVVAGYERVFEIARNFRNEGIDTRHSPEFTSVEAYRAYGDARDGMALSTELVIEVARAATGRTCFSAGDHQIDLEGPWPELALLDLVQAAVGERVHPSMPVETLRALCARHGVATKPEWGTGKLIFELYDVVVLPSLVGPAFVVGFPIEVSPLARRQPGDDTLADRFELVIDGREFANGYSELNIPDEQAARFAASARAAAGGDPEAHPADLAYVRALELGLPPTSGIGIGVDRLVMLLAEVRAIRDVILFPVLRPEATS